MTATTTDYDIIKRNSFTFFTCFLFVALIGAEKAPALLSIAMICQALSILIFTSPKKLLQNFAAQKPLVIFSFCYLFLLLSFFYSDNFTYLFERLQIKIPLLLYPLICPSIGRLSPNQKRMIMLTAIGVILGSVIGILINYMLHFDQINQLYLQSKIMPGPIHHIRFSLLTVFAIYLCYYCVQQPITKTQRIALSAVAVFFVIFLHIYSVRSGLLSLYVVIVILLVNYAVRTRNLKHLLIAITSIVIIAGGSILLSPTLKNKISNTTTDVNVYQNQEDPNFNSLATRMVSYKIALEIFKENIWFGCGQGDLKDKNDGLFRKDYPTVLTPIIPHNQFIYYLAATGIIGLLIFMISFMAPLWSRRNFRNEFIMISYVILVVAFQFEPMLETQLGVATTLVILFIPYYQLQEQQTKALLHTRS
ncbi:MAG: O-antigen ligase family protein [Bacteroidota bacterium]